MSRFSSKSNNLLKDNSWIKRADDEDEDVDRDPNYGKSVLGRTRSNDLEGSEAETANAAKPVRSSTSVQALTKRFSGSQDDLQDSIQPSSKTSSYTRSSTSKAVAGESKSSTTTTMVTKDGTTETTFTSTTQTLRSPISSPTQTFTDRVKSSSKESKYTSYSPAKTTKVTETIANNEDAEDKLYDTLIPSSIIDNSSTTSSKRTVSSTEIVTVKSSTDPSVESKLYDSLIPSSIKEDFSSTDSKTSVFSTMTVKSSSSVDATKTITRTSSTPEDDLYDTLLPRSITSPLSSPVSSGSIKKREIVSVASSKGGQSPTLSSPSSSRTISYSSYTDDVPSTRTSSYTISTKPSEDYSSEHKTSTYSRSESSSYEYSSITSPTVYTTSSYRNSRSDDTLTDPVYTRSSIKSVYASPERTLLERDLCTYCHRPFNGDAKMVLEDMKINCHASCFKCEVCSSTLGHMKAGDCLWIYRRMVHCENCFDITREKWRH